MLVDHKYLKYLHKTETIVFTYFYAIKQDKYDLSSIIITKIGWFGYAIYSWADTHC